MVLIFRAFAGMLFFPTFPRLVQVYGHETATWARSCSENERLHRKTAGVRSGFFVSGLRPQRQQCLGNGAKLLQRQGLRPHIRIQIQVRKDRIQLSHIQVPILQDMF